MATKRLEWVPTTDEVRSIVAGMSHVIDECVRRFDDVVAEANEDAEVDGNRTRRTGFARASRFEGGGRHQVA